MRTAFSQSETQLICAILDTSSPKLDSVVFLRRLLPLFEGLPYWLRSAALRVFPAGTRVHDIIETVTTLDKRTKEIYADKKRALAKGDAEMVKQVGQGKDIISILRTCVRVYSLE